MLLLKDTFGNCPNRLYSIITGTVSDSKWFKAAGGNSCCCIENHPKPRFGMALLLPVLMQFHEALVHSSSRFVSAAFQHHPSPLAWVGWWTISLRLPFAHRSAWTRTMPTGNRTRHAVLRWRKHDKVQNRSSSGCYKWSARATCLLEIAGSLGMVHSWLLPFRLFATRWLAQIHSGRPLWWASQTRSSSQPGPMTSGALLWGGQPGKGTVRHLDSFGIIGIHCIHWWPSPKNVQAIHPSFAIGQLHIVYSIDKVKTRTCHHYYHHC